MSTLSICTACQDEEEPIKWYLECCKHTFSVLGDSLKEIVLIDGGSKDNTIDIIKDYQKILPINLLERPYDNPRDQQNAALDYCTGDYVFTPDADMTWTSNFPAVFQRGFFDSNAFWDFILLFTVRDAYHYFKHWNIGANMRLHRRGPKWHRKHHVQFPNQSSQLGFCGEVIIFENSGRIKSEKALLNRGERRQKFFHEMEEEGGDPGPADRFYLASKAPDSDVALISNFNSQIADLILPETNG